jgi:NAD(P)-dependent dehydrogenase (short-subunit alcohol dehydrogenase family)
MVDERKVAIVTGGNKGIGKGIAIRLNEKGYNVVIAARDEEAGLKVIEKINKNGGNNLFIKTDVSDKKQVDSMVQKAQSLLGRIDVLVNNAAIVNDSPFLDLTEEVWDKTLNINLKGYFLCSQAAARMMVKNNIKGKIVNITSVQGVTVWPLVAHAPYEVSKAGIIMLTKQLSFELAKYGITVNAVGPGPTATEILEPWTKNPDKLKSITDKIPLGRIATPEDVASVVAFLSSGEADYLTGITIFVDGGRMTW